MLSMPEIGFQRSIDVSNVNSNASADWLESTLLFDEQELSKNEVVDILLEEQICDSDSQDMAHQIANEAWNELERRQHWGGLPKSVNLTNNRILTTKQWTDEIVRAFFVLLSIQRIFPHWASNWAVLRGARKFVRKSGRENLSSIVARLENLQSWMVTEQHEKCS